VFFTFYIEHCEFYILLLLYVTQYRKMIGVFIRLVAAVVFYLRQGSSVLACVCLSVYGSVNS